MDVANPRHATFLPGRVVPLFFEERAPLRNAFAAVAAKAIPEIAGFFPVASLRTLFFRSNSHSAVAPTAFAAVPASEISGTTAFLTIILLRTFLLVNNINNAPAPTNDACTVVRCAKSSNLAVPSQARRLALRAPRWRR